MPRRAARVDLNQAEIVSALRAHGASVTSLAAVGSGVPDLLVGYLRTNHLLEVKGPKGRLTADQEKWMAAWGGSFHVVRTVKEALDAVGVGFVGI